MQLHQLHGRRGPRPGHPGRTTSRAGSRAPGRHWARSTRSGRSGPGPGGGPPQEVGRTVPASSCARTAIRRASARDSSCTSLTTASLEPAPGRAPLRNLSQSCNSELQHAYAASMATRAPESDGRRKAAAARRRKREAEIIAATRDAVRPARGARGADRGHRARRRDQPGDRLPALHRQGGAVRAHPRAATSTSCARPSRRPPTTEQDPERPARLPIVGAFVDYGVAHPAFVDCAQSLMRMPRRRAARRDLRERAVPARPRHLVVPERAVSGDRVRGRVRRLRHAEPTRPCSPTRSTPAASARSSSPASASW